MCSEGLRKDIRDEKPYYDHSSPLYIYYSGAQVMETKNA